MTVMTTAGSQFRVTATAPATLDATGYNAIYGSMSLVGEVTDMGEVGREYNVVNHNPISDRLTQKIKGSYNSGSISLQFGRDFSDAGQSLLFTASRSDARYSFVIVLQNGKRLYFTGMVTGFKNSVGSVDQITSATCTIELMTDVLEV